MILVGANGPRFSFAGAVEVRGDLVEVPWAPRRTGLIVADNAIGREAAEELLEHIRTTNDHALLGSIIRCMMSAGSFDGVEAGFFAGLSQAAA